MAAALKETPSKYKESVEAWIASSLDEMKAMKKRDQKIAESLISKDGSSLGTIGLLHLESVMESLVDQCKKTLNHSTTSPVHKQPTGIVK